MQHIIFIILHDLILFKTIIAFRLYCNQDCAQYSKQLDKCSLQ